MDKVTPSPGSATLPPSRPVFQISQPSALPASPPAAVHSAISYLLLALILPVFAVAPLLYPGYIQSHTGLVTLWNVADLRLSLGHFGWLPHLAFTFDPLRSSGLLPYYLAAWLPLSPPGAVKLVVGLAWLLGSLGMFLWLRGWLGQAGALVAALVYTYLPYQIAAVYVRGTWGETLFWGLLPWAMLFASRPGIDSVSFALPARQLRPSLLAPDHLLAHRLPVLGAVAVSWLLLGLSHLGLTWWAFIFLLAFLGLGQRRAGLGPGLAAAAGAAVATFMVLKLAGGPVPPATPLTDHLLYPFQLFSAYWGFGSSRPGWNDGLSLQIGLAGLGLTMLSLALWPYARASRWPDGRLVFFTGAALLLMLLQLYPAAPLWRLPLAEGLNLASTLAYPWVLSGLVGLCLAVLAGSALWLDQRLADLPLLAVMVIIILLSSYSYLAPHFMQVDQPLSLGPQALVGNNQLALLDHSLEVSINGNTAGLEQGRTAIPVAAYGLPQAGDILILKVTWYPLQPFSQDFKIFVHLVDSHNQVLAQFDGQPRGGEYPTSGWIPGELITDAYALTLPADIPPGPYRLYLGLYDEATLSRLPVSGDTEGRIILDVQ